MHHSFCISLSKSRSSGLEKFNGNARRDISYNSKENIFENINFTVEKGDVFCILGANGTGKTTMIKCLNSLMKLKSGNVFLNGEDIYSFDHSEIARNIGYIPQMHNSTFPFTILDVVLMGRAPHIIHFLLHQKVM